MTELPYELPASAQSWLRESRTVLLATHNGGGTLPRTLAAFTALRPPRGGWRLVVVDNASDDDTKSIIGSFTGSLPITYLHEARPGKNAALNTGLAHVSGDLVVFTDDDVVPRKDWLVEIRALTDAEPDFAVQRAAGWQFNSATCYFNRTILAQRLLETWLELCEARPEIWDQIHLDTAWEIVTARHPLRPCGCRRPTRRSSTCSVTTASATRGPSSSSTRRRGA